MTLLRKMAGACVTLALAATGAAYGQFQQDPQVQQPGQQAGQAQEPMAVGEAQVRERQGPVIELQDQQQATMTAIFRQEHDAPEIIVMESSGDQAMQAREIVFSPEQAQNRVVTYEGQAHAGQERSLVVTARRQDQDVEVEQISQQEGIIVLGVRRQQEQDQQAMPAGEQMQGERQAGQFGIQPGQEQEMDQQAGVGQEAQQQQGMDQPAEMGQEAQQQAQQAEGQQQMQQDAQMAADQADQEQPTPDAYDAVIVIFLTSPY